MARDLEIIFVGIPEGEPWSKDPGEAVPETPSRGLSYSWDKTLWSYRSDTSWSSSLPPQSTIQPKKTDYTEREPMAPCQPPLNENSSA